MAESEILLLDTGPLRELILYAAVENLGFASQGRNLQFLQSEGHYKNLATFISNFKERLTTPHVISEISTWIVRTFDSGRSDIWRSVFDEFRRMRMNEETYELLNMPVELVAQIGAADVGLVKIASRLGPRAPTVLSIDSALIAKCKDEGLQAVHLWEVVAAEIA